MTRVDELAGAGDQADRAHLLIEVVDGARDLEGELRDAVAEGGERHAFEHDAGEAAIGGRVARAFLGLDQRVGELVLAADVETPGELREVELGAVGPDAADAGNWTLGEGDGEVGEVAVLDAGCGGGGRLAGAALAAAAGSALLHHLLLDCRGPDDLAAEARAAVETGDGRAFRGGGDAQVGEAGAVRDGRLAGRGEQRLVDEGAGERADLGAERGAADGGAEQGDAGRQQCAADRGAGGCECESGHLGGG